MRPIIVPRRPLRLPAVVSGAAMTNGSSGRTVKDRQTEEKPDVGTKQVPRMKETENTCITNS